MSFAKIEQNIANAKPFEAKFLRRRASAMIITSLAAFLAMCFLWSLSIKGFTSNGELIVSGAKNANIEQVLQNLVHEELKQENLSRHILAATEKSGIENQDVVNRRFESVVKAFRFNIYKNKNLPEYQLKAGFQGRGSDGEQVLVDSILRSIAQKLESADGGINNIGEIEKQYAKIHNGIEKTSASRHAQLEDASNELQHLDADLSVVYDEVTAIRSLPEPIARTEKVPSNSIDPTALSMMKSLANQLEDLLEERMQMQVNDSVTIEQINAVDNDIREVRGEIEDLEDSYPNMYVQKQTVPAMNASHARDGAIDQALRSIETLNTDSVRQKLSDVQKTIRTDAVRQREQVATLRTLTNESVGESYSVRSISQVKNRPTDGVPTLAHLLVFGLGALTLGSVVATNFRPELVDRGFESVDEAEQTLGVPVVGKLPAATNISDGDETGATSIANRTVSFCEIGLFATILVVIFLCFISPSIREAFFENPLHGLAQISWMILGR